MGIRFKECIRDLHYFDLLRTNVIKDAYCIIYLCIAWIKYEYEEVINQVLENFRIFGQSILRHILPQLFDDLLIAIYPNLIQNTHEISKYL